MAKVEQRHREKADQVWRESNDPASSDFGPELMAHALAEVEAASRGAAVKGEATGDDELIREMLDYYIDRINLGPSSELRAFTKDFIARARGAVPFVPATTPPAQDAGQWIHFDMTDPNGPDIDDGTPAWIVWNGVVQEQPWIWDHHEGMGPAWLVTAGNAEPDRVVLGVSHYLPCLPPPPPTESK